MTRDDSATTPDRRERAARGLSVGTLVGNLVGISSVETGDTGPNTGKSLTFKYPGLQEGVNTIHYANE